MIKLLRSFDVNAKVNCGTKGGVYYKSYFYNSDVPLIITFSNMGEITYRKNFLNPFYSPWGYEFVKKQGFNVLSFSCYEDVNWYRNELFHQFLQDIAPKISDRFEDIWGYAGSMGAYAAGAFSQLLNINRLLLLNPISTLSSDIAPFETRYKRFREKLDWSGAYHDASKTYATGYVIYDPLFTLDVKHALRFSTLEKLHVPGVGHGMPYHLLKLGMLGWVFDKFSEGYIDKYEFGNKCRKRREYANYYKWMQSNENIHLTKKRKEIIGRHSMLNDIKQGKSTAVSQKDIDAIRDIALSLEKSDFDIAMQLMNIAYRARPGGEFIEWKVKQYQAQIKK